MAWFEYYICDVATEIEARAKATAAEDTSNVEETSGTRKHKRLAITFHVEWGGKWQKRN